LQAVVLVGGEGTRLRPLTYDIPKPMLPIVERPIIARVLEWLALHGIDRAVLALGYRPDPFMEAFPESSWEGVEILYAAEPQPLDTAGAIAYAADYAGVADERLVILNGDVLTDLDLSKLVAYHEERGGLATICLTPVEDPSPFGVVALDEDGRIHDFVEKPAPGEAPSNLINAGTYIFEPEALATIERGRRVSVEREVLPLLTRRGQAFAVDSDAYWIDTGTPDRYVKAQLDVIAGLRPNVILPDCAEVRPGLFLGPEAELSGEVLGNAFVGSHAIVEEGAVVEDSVIGTAVRVRAGGEVRGSVVLRDTSIEPGARVSYSVIGPGAKVGRRAMLMSSVIGANTTVEDGADLTDGRLPG
jgi:mannose-1-phosphate guanylyltransferase